MTKIQDKVFNQINITYREYEDKTSFNLGNTSFNFSINRNVVSQLIGWWDIPYPVIVELDMVIYRLINFEVSNVKLFSLNECHKIIRPYYISKLNAIKKGFQLINSLGHFFE